MSFISKGLKKVWKFVKDNWVAIALAVAVVFTAGVATVGFGAFSAAGFGSGAAVAGTAAGAGTFGSFMGAVGSTMWAGVAGAAGSMGVGAGATVPTTAASVAAGTAGTQVGLGAAWGAGAAVGNTGASVGFDMTGKLGANTAAKLATTAGDTAKAQALLGGKTVAEAEAASRSAIVAANSANLGSNAVPTALGKSVAGGGGMTTGQATLLAGAAGPALTALGSGEPDTGGAPIWYSTAGGAGKERRANNPAPEVDGVAAPGAPGAGASGEGVKDFMVDRQMNRPLMGQSSPRGMDGQANRAEDDLSLMGGQYANA